jgi:hypothetical protein
LEATESDNASCTQAALHWGKHASTSESVLTRESGRAKRDIRKGQTGVLGSTNRRLSDKKEKKRKKEKKKKRKKKAQFLTEFTLPRLFLRSCNSSGSHFGVKAGLEHKVENEQNATEFSQKSGTF